MILSRERVEIDDDATRRARYQSDVRVGRVFPLGGDELGVEHRVRCAMLTERVLAFRLAVYASAAALAFVFDPMKRDDAIAEAGVFGCRCS